MLTRFRSKNSKEKGDRKGKRNSAFAGKEKPGGVNAYRAWEHCSPGKRSATGEKNGLNIDIRRFQGVLFDEGTTWFNRITH